MDISPATAWTGADQRRQESEDTVPGVGPRMPRDAHRGPGTLGRPLRHLVIDQTGDFSAA